MKEFILNPESFPLFRGENQTNKGGTHFTLDESWAKNFGSTLLKIQLPAGSKIRLITKDDFKNGLEKGFTSDQLLWDFIFSKEDCDALVGHDAMNSGMIDVIVNPKHLTKTIKL